MRKALAGLLIIALGLFGIGAAAAQDSYPNRPVKILIGFPVGGLLDTVSRVVGEKMGEVQPAVGAFYATNGAAAATTVMGITCGLSKMVAANLSLGAEYVIFESLSVAGASTTGVLGPAVVGIGVPGIGHAVTLSAAYYL